MKGGLINNNSSTKNETPYLLGTDDIDGYLGRRLGQNYIGCFSKDELGKYLGSFGKNHYAVLNMDDVKGPGTHWVALGKKGRRWYYFDSIGQPPPQIVEDNCEPLFTHRETIQKPYNTDCGLYCIRFVLDLYAEK